VVRALGLCDGLLGRGEEIVAVGARELGLEEREIGPAHRVVLAGGRGIERAADARQVAIREGDTRRDTLHLRDAGSVAARDRAGASGGESARRGGRVAALELDE